MPHDRVTNWRDGLMLRVPTDVKVAIWIGGWQYCLSRMPWYERWARKAWMTVFDGAWYMRAKDAIEDWWWRG